MAGWRAMQPRAKAQPGGRQRAEARVMKGKPRKSGKAPIRRLSNLELSGSSSFRPASLPLRAHESLDW